MAAHAHLPDFEEALLAVCRAKGVRAHDVITLTVLSRLLESKGIRRTQCMHCVRRAVRRGWVVRGPLPGQITLTPDGFAAVMNARTGRGFDLPLLRP